MASSEVQRKLTAILSTGAAGRGLLKGCLPMVGAPAAGGGCLFIFFILFSTSW